VDNYSYASKKRKISILFEGKNIPASLYKCLWAFATNNVNLTKIENLPSFWKPFASQFWVDFEGSLDDENVQKSLDELKLFTSELRILWEY
jgi:prephenate dehydratase